jgi:protein tyrosine phosphatase (PTP) superfamily phosphohydrolase (DUF442 family)
MKTSMTNPRSGRVLLAALIALSSVLAPAAFSQDEIRNFLWVNSNFCTAGQPTIEQLTSLRDQGVKAVLNLRPAAEFDATEEEARVRELGMRYFNIPVAGGNPIPDAQFDEFLSLTDQEENHPMFIHCASANRVGAFWLVRRVVRDDWEVDRAEEEAQRVGLRAASLRDYALDYISRHSN